MKTRDERIRYIVRHKDGHFINILCETVTDWMKATRWNSVEEVDGFLTGHYAPPDPDNYYAHPIHITYELGGTENVQQE